MRRARLQTPPWGKPEGSDGLQPACSQLFSSRCLKSGGGNLHPNPLRGVWKHKQEWALRETKFYSDARNGVFCIVPLCFNLEVIHPFICPSPDPSFHPSTHPPTCPPTQQKSESPDTGNTQGDAGQAPTLTECAFPLGKETAHTGVQYITEYSGRNKHREE